MDIEVTPDPRFELGADLYSVGLSDSIVFNGKWLLCSEQKGRPAVAVGGMELGAGFAPTSYLVATKDIGQGLRLHLGGAVSAEGHAVLLGAEKRISERDYLLADLASWSAGYRSLGVYHEVRPGVAVSLAYASPNAGGEPGLLMLNAAWTCPLR